MPTISQSSTKYGSLGFFLDVQKVMINVLTARKLNKCRVKSNSRLVGMVVWVVQFSMQGCNVRLIFCYKSSTYSKKITCSLLLIRAFNFLENKVFEKSSKMSILKRCSKLIFIIL